MKVTRIVSKEVHGFFQTMAMDLILLLRMKLPIVLPGERNIVWSYRQENGQTILQYKRLPGGIKAKDITDGYKFNIVSATEANLSLRSRCSFRRKYNFYQLCFF